MSKISILGMRHRNCRTHQAHGRKAFANFSAAGGWRPRLTQAYDIILIIMYLQNDTTGGYLEGQQIDWPRCVHGCQHIDNKFSQAPKQVLATRHLGQHDGKTQTQPWCNPVDLSNSRSSSSLRLLFASKALALGWHLLLLD